MRYTKAHIDTIAYELPPQVVTTEELEARLAPVYDALHIAPGQLEHMTGVRERRWWEPGFRVSNGAIAAARKALAQSGVSPRDIEVVIFGGVCRDLYEPAAACAVAHAIGASPEASVFDVSNACLGVINGIVDIANRIELGQVRAGMIVSCETSREIIEIQIERMLQMRDMPTFIKCLATLTGGSGAVAVVVTDGSFGPRRRRILGGNQMNAPEHHELCRWGIESPQPGSWKPFMMTDSASVLKYGVELGRRTWEAFLPEVGWKSAEDVDKTVCHQVGAPHRDKILSTLGIDPEKDFPTFEFLGNIGTVSLPITAALAEERGALETGDRVAFLGIGSGLNCMMLGIEW
ncbi:3-oxoacyl-ACP synthase III [Candidatus Sumerlaeota bacterium]|nr:3-oxoacyl-ACP synthase III [Candidatus Sumerlaeota bacterium]